MLTRRGFLVCSCGCVGSLLGACVTTGGDSPPAPTISPGYRPAAADESGLWYQMEQAEADIQRSPFLLRDPALNAYVREVACRVIGDYCPDVRIYLLRTPYFNASMAPNGMMQVWSGLLLRVRNEAQLAAVIGHELGHYARQHSLVRWRGVRNATDFAIFFRMGLALAGLGIVGDLAHLAIIAGYFSYTRDQEREADEFGQAAMVKAGFAPIEAARVWEQLIAETSAAEVKPEREIVFATHPAPEERAETLRRLAATHTPPGVDALGRERLAGALRQHRGWLLTDQLKLRQFGRTIYVLDQLIGEGDGLGELHFYKGEAFRMRGESGDERPAREAFELALAHADAPAEAHRSLGLLQRKAGEGDAAGASFRRYLALRPEAADRAMIESYLTPGS